MGQQERAEKTGNRAHAEDSWEKRAGIRRRQHQKQQRKKHQKKQQDKETKKQEGEGAAGEVP